MIVNYEEGVVYEWPPDTNCIHVNKAEHESRLTKNQVQVRVYDRGHTPVIRGQQLHFSEHKTGTVTVMGTNLKSQVNQGVNFHG